MLDQAAALLVAHGHRRAVVNAHWLPAQIRAWAAAQADLELHVSVEDPDILGTGGGLRAALPWLDETFTIVNGDILCDVDLTALRAAVPPGGAAMALRALAPRDPYGIVAADAAGCVVDLVGLARAAPEGPVDRGTHFTGVHAMHRDAIEAHVPPEGQACVVRTAYTALVPHRRVRALRHGGAWFDVGTPTAYLRANLEAVRGALALPLDPRARAALAIDDRGAVGDRSRADIHPTAALAGPVWIGPGAAIAAGAVVGPGAVIGAGARVGAGAQVVESVVWSGRAVPAGVALEGAIVHDGGTLIPPR